MLKQVQHDMTVRFWSFCHPEPGPELDSGSIDFGISVLGLENLGFKAPPCGRGSLLTILKKPWAYIAGMVFGLVHLVLVLPLVVLKLHPGFGPLIVIPACVLMIVFSYLSFKKRNKVREFA